MSGEDYENGYCHRCCPTKILTLQNQFQHLGGSYHLMHSPKLSAECCSHTFSPRPSCQRRKHLAEQLSDWSSAVLTALGLQGISWVAKGNKAALDHGIFSNGMLGNGG